MQILLFAHHPILVNYILFIEQSSSTNTFSSAFKIVINSEKKKKSFFFLEFIFKVSVLEKAIMCLLAVLRESLFLNEPPKTDCQSPEWNCWCVNLRAQQGPAGPWSEFLARVNPTVFELSGSHWLRNFWALLPSFDVCCFEGYSQHVALPRAEITRSQLSWVHDGLVWKHPWKNTEGWISDTDNVRVHRQLEKLHLMCLNYG